MSFLTPLAFIATLLAIPIILLYMLRLRRREVLVSSTFLWQQLLQDNEANTPWQRLRRNLLLLLQLLILAALIFALARPFITVPAVGAGQITLLLDASASMNATDINGESRFEAAKREALNAVNTMSATDSMTIIRVTDVPEVITPATSDRLALIAAISGAQPSQASADWSGALTLAIGSAGNSPDFNLVVVSDGGLGDPALLPEVPGEVTYVPIGQDNANITISAMATRSLPGQPPQLFAQLTNYGDQDAEVVFSLTVDGALFESEFYTIPAQSDTAITRPMPEDFSTIAAEVAMRSGSAVPDYLVEDNVAWAVSSGTGTRSTLLMSDGGNLFMEQVLRSLPGIEAFQGDLARGLPTRAFDLYILDRWLPNPLPDGDLLIIAPPRSTDLFTVGAGDLSGGSITVESEDPRMEFVDFDNVNILSYTAISNADWADTLISAPGGPLVLAGEVDGRQVAIISFDIHNSDLPLQITWPILMANLMQWFAPQTVLTTTNTLNVGDPLVIRPPLTADNILITQPDSSERVIPVDRQSLIYADTSEAGIYQLDVQTGDSIQQTQLFTVNLFDPNESRIQPQASITLGGTTFTPVEGEEVGQLELWPVVALLALLILLIEWYVYHQRIKAPTIFQPTPRRVARGTSA